jgi:hypothetical protein
MDLLHVRFACIRAILIFVIKNRLRYDVEIIYEGGAVARFLVSPIFITIKPSNQHITETLKLPPPLPTNPLTQQHEGLIHRRPRRRRSGSCFSSAPCWCSSRAFAYRRFLAPCRISIMDIRSRALCLPHCWQPMGLGDRRPPFANRPFLLRIQLDQRVGHRHRRMGTWHHSGPWRLAQWRWSRSFRRCEWLG